MAVDVTVEPWLRGTLADVDAVRRQVLHALELTGEDITGWCAGLSDAEIHARPFGLPPVAFHLRHIARSLDRLLTYAEGRQLSGEQTASLRLELEPNGAAETLLAEVRVGLEDAAARVRAFSPGSYDEARGVGRRMLPASVGGLLIHCAEHTQRHAGQAITTARLLGELRKERGAEQAME